VLFDIFDGILNRPNLLGVLVGDVDLERFLERQDEFDQTKRISTQIIDEYGFRFDIRLINVQLFLDDSLYFGRNIATCRHFFCLQQIVSRRERVVHPDRRRISREKKEIAAASVVSGD
jgi:hypothetical protein